MVIVILSAFVVGYQTIYGWYRLAKETARGPEPPDYYQDPLPSIAFSFSDEDDPGRASVWVGSTSVIVFRSSHHERSPAQRARDAANVIQDFLEDRDATAVVTIDHTGEGQPTVLLNGETVAVVDEETARANNSRPEDLARVWAENLRVASGRE